MAYVDFNDLTLSAPEYFCLIKPVGTHGVPMRKS